MLEYAKHTNDSEDIIEKAVIPTLVCIAKAPPISPIADIEIDSALRFLAAITSIREKQNVSKKQHGFWLDQYLSTFLESDVFCSNYRLTS